MVDKGGTSSHTHSGGLLLADSWSIRDQWGGMTPGPSHAFVAGNSYGDLADDVVCGASGASDSITITT